MAKNKSLTNEEMIVVVIESAGYVPAVDLSNFQSNLTEHYLNDWGEDEINERIPYWKEYGWVVSVPE